MISRWRFCRCSGSGGLTGLPLRARPPGHPPHDTDYGFFGPFHYVVAPRAIFALFAGIITGSEGDRTEDEES